MAKKRFRLDPTKTAQENLWEAAKVASIYILLHSHINDKKIYWCELLENITFRGVRYFYIKLRNHEYDRTHSFFENVYSCCYSASSHEIKYLCLSNRRKQNYISTDSYITSNITVADSIEDRGPVLYNPPKHTLNRKIMEFDEKARFGIISYKHHPLEAFEAAWRIQDEEAALLGLEIPKEAMERRDEIRKRIADETDEKRRKKLERQREYKRKRKESKNKKAAN